MTLFPATPSPSRYPLVPPRQHEAYDLGVEDVRSIAFEMAALVEAFARETSGSMRWQPPSALALVEQQNRGYVTVTVRHADVIVGFCRAHRVREGAADAGMYLVPEHRGGWTAVHLARYVQDFMAALGAQWMWWECDEASGSYALAEHLNHQLISRRYLVALKGALA
jgi:hypothetical protein